MKLSFFDKHPSKKSVSPSSFHLTPTPSLVDSLEDDDDSMSDDETVAVSNVSATPSHNIDEQPDLPSSKHRATTFLTFPSNWGSTFLCGSLQVVYYVDD